MYICPLGTTSQITMAIKNIGYKKDIYPFDWIIIDSSIVIDCIENDFFLFLDKNNYRSLTKNKCGHNTYKDLIFNYFDPSKDSKYYDMLTKSVDNFRKLLQNNDKKIFIQFLPNQNDEDEYQDTCQKTNSVLKKYTTNYLLIQIIHFPNKNKMKYTKEISENSITINLETISKSNGKLFEYDDDNAFFINTIKTIIDDHHNTF